MDDPAEMPTDKELEIAEDNGNFELILEKLQPFYPELDFKELKPVLHQLYLLGQIAALEKSQRELKRRHEPQKPELPH